MKNIFVPFAKISKQVLTIMVAGQVVLTLVLWHLSASGLIPKPFAVAKAFAEFATTRMLLDNVLTSIMLTFQALLYSIMITLFFTYLSVIPFFKTIALFIVKARYLTLTGLSFIFIILTQDGEQLKLSLLIFGMVPFFVTSFLGVILNIDKQQFELCKTLGYSHWKTVYEVIIIGKADQVLEILRQNFAISWLMITMVETYSMSQGGIGVLIYKFSKYNDLTSVLALQLVIFIIGLGFDYLLGALRKWFFPYTNLK